MLKSNRAYGKNGVRAVLKKNLWNLVTRALAITITTLLTYEPGHPGICAGHHPPCTLHRPGDALPPPPRRRPCFLLPGVGPQGLHFQEVSSIKMKSRIQGKGFLFSVFPFGGTLIKLLI